MHEHDQNYAALYRDVIPSVVSIYVTARTSGSAGTGSGFVYDGDGHVVTNHHVLHGVGGRSNGGRAERAPPADLDPDPELEVEVRFSEGEWRVGRLVGTDRYTDLAVIAVEGVPDYATPLAVATDNPEPGRPVAAFGNPMGLDGTITTGIVSGVSRTTPVGGGEGFAIPDVVQTDAAINPGNSGGPLVAIDDGEPVVVGVNRAKQGENIGFSISPAVVSRIVPDLVDTGSSEHATLHVSTLDVSPAVAEANDLAEPGGVLVVDVREGPASGVLGGCHSHRRVRGRRVPVGGDVIVGVDDRELRSAEELTSYLLTEKRPGEAITLSVRRAAGETTETVVLATREGDRDPSPSGTRVEIR
ncbi:S1C family serine protease [Halomontanus rarus]|uniref:S1C family serine protease n=1 Tax=Halomontanus rarus TaxID=3034020 RepID=UPI0023E87FBE|nr:trypsin-like peptidase domain-containing protein [Halovivax sp. TS33]